MGAPPGLLQSRNSPVGTANLKPASGGLTAAGSLRHTSLAPALTLRMIFATSAPSVTLCAKTLRQSREAQAGTTPAERHSSGSSSEAVFRGAHVPHVAPSACLG
jgi:hypothetical protein